MIVRWRRQYQQCLDLLLGLCGAALENIFPSPSRTLRMFPTVSRSKYVRPNSRSNQLTPFSSSKILLLSNILRQTLPVKLLVFVRNQVYVVFSVFSWIIGLQTDSNIYFSFEINRFFCSVSGDREWRVYGNLRPPRLGSDNGVNCFIFCALNHLISLAQLTPHQRSYNAFSFVR
jgi:hypothetical protein